MIDAKEAAAVDPANPELKKLELQCVQQMTLRCEPYLLNLLSTGGGERPSEFQKF